MAVKGVAMKKASTTVGKAEAVFINIRRPREIADAGEQRRQDRHGDEDTVHAAACEEVVAERF